MPAETQSPSDIDVREAICTVLNNCFYRVHTTAVPELEQGDSVFSARWEGDDLILIAGQGIELVLRSVYILTLPFSDNAPEFSVRSLVEEHNPELVKLVTSRGIGPVNIHVLERALYRADMARYNQWAAGKRPEELRALFVGRGPIVDVEYGENADGTFVRFIFDEGSVRLRIQHELGSFMVKLGKVPLLPPPLPTSTRF